MISQRPGWIGPRRVPGGQKARCQDLIVRCHHAANSRRQRWEGRQGRGADAFRNWRSTLAAKYLEHNFLKANGDPEPAASRGVWNRTLVVKIEQGLRQ
jgi:hypothetical protein